jgi:hypothetical protein
MTDDFRTEAEEHWKFLEPLLHDIVINDVKHLNITVVKYLYVEALVHGFKHGKADKKR